MSGAGEYKIRSTEENVVDLMQECNRIFGLLSDRLDKMEGYRGRPSLNNDLLSGYDIVITDASKGLVLRDDGNPGSYWRVTIDDTGTLQYENIGRDY